MQNSTKHDKLLSIQKQCNNIAQSFAGLSPELGELVHIGSDSDVSQAESPAVIGELVNQIATATKVREEFEVNSK